MERWIVVFTSAADEAGRVDEHFVDVRAPSMLRAVKTALRDAPPHHEWALAIALPWPRVCFDIDAAVQALESA